MESSDDDFAWSWSNASACSDDSDIEHTMSESESDKKYKKKLLKRIFEEEIEAEVKHELMNGKMNHESESQELDSPASPAPAAHPASRKRKRERERAPSQGSEPDLHLLEKRVKREHSISHTHNDTCKGNETKDESNVNDSSQELEENVNFSKTVKKKKSERKREKQLNVTNDEIESEVIIEEQFSAEDFVASRPESRLTNEHAQETEHVIDNGTPHKSKKGKKKKHKDQEHREISQRENDDHNDSILNVGNDTLYNKSTKQTNMSALQQRTTKISDLIHFEDEEYVEAGHSGSAETQTSQLRRFLKTYPHLQPFRGQPHLAALSTDEDIWLLNCPKEVDITSLQGIDMSLDSKCKLKTNNQTYIGNIQNENSSIPILIFEHEKLVVKNIILNGIVNYRKRIPKPHYINDNMIENLSDFIPLPETKNRHPLFGPDYKKAIKIPSAIKARLNNSFVSNNPPSLEGKKKKKDKMEFKEESSHNSSAIKREEESGKGGGGRKQRRSAPGGAQSAPKKKNKKFVNQEVSIGSWDSEKAIEENLFNF